MTAIVLRLITVVKFSTNYHKRKKILSDAVRITADTYYTIVPNGF